MIVLGLATNRFGAPRVCCQLAPSLTTGGWERGSTSDRERSIRRVTPEDVPFLWDMVYEAAVVDLAYLSRAEVLALPEVRRYVEGWGRPGDAGVVALNASGRKLGAAWYRTFPAESPGYGFVAPDVPEISIGVVAEARGRGAGGALLEALKELALEQGYGRISLSVSRRNPALRLYERHGFSDAGISSPSDSSVTLVAELQ